MQSPKAPTPGQHDVAGAPDHARIACHHRLMADGLKRLVNAAQISHAVVNDCDHESVQFQESRNNTATRLILPLLSLEIKRGQALGSLPPLRLSAATDSR